MSGSGGFTAGQRARAVRLVAEARPGCLPEWAAIGSVAAELGTSAETARMWGGQAGADGGRRGGVAAEEAAGIGKLRREVAGLRRADEILPAAPAFCAAALGRPLPRS